jgi:hypothetical protein
MKNLVIFILFFGNLCLSNLIAQDSTEYSFRQLQENITEILSQSDEEINLDELTDYLYQLTTNPVKINSADDSEIRRLFWLTEFQIINVIRYTQKNGLIHSVYELPYIEGFSEQDAKLLAPFLNFENAESKKKNDCYFRFNNQMLLLRSSRVLEKQAGFKTDNSSRFVGTPGSFYTRYHIYNENFSAGITGEKDSGEEFFTGSNSKGFDFYSFHLQLSNLGLLKTIILGDYKLNFGDGLITGTALNLGKTPSVLSSAYQNSGVTRYTATNENNFFRGVAFTLLQGKKELSLFYSNHAVDANVVQFDTVNNKVTEVSSLQTSGLHTTHAEISDKDAIKNQALGAHLKFRGIYSEFGFTLLYNKFPALINPTIEPYNADYFRGTSNYNLGVNFRIRTGNILWFGEEAYSKSKSFALLNGVQAHPFSGMLLNVIYRNYDAKYQAMFGNAFGENTRNQNEKGLYFGIQCNLVKYIALTGYADFFYFPKLRYGVDMPSEGQEYMGQLTFSPNSNFQLYVQYRINQKEENEILVQSPANIVISKGTEHTRLGISYRVNSSLTLLNRLEYSSCSKEQSTSSDGYFIAQDVDYKIPVMPVRLYARYAIFDVNSYDSRIYAYESDILYTFSMPSFYNKGFRFCFMAKISPVKIADLWIKYSVTQYSDKETISSGLYEINGNHKSEVCIQLLLHFK